MQNGVSRISLVTTLLFSSVTIFMPFVFIDIFLPRNFYDILSPHRCLTRRARPTRQAIDLSRKFILTQTFLESTILITCLSLYDNGRKLYRGSWMPELDQPRLRGLDRGREGLSSSESPRQWKLSESPRQWKWNDDDGNAN